MRPYELRRADELRKELIAQLGKRCAECDATRRLEFNHKFQRTWRAADFNRYQRMLKYRREIALGWINILCRSCNASHRRFQQ